MDNSNKTKNFFEREHAECDLWERRQRILKRQYDMAFEFLDRQDKMNREKIEQLKDILEDIRNLHRLRTNQISDC
jgi:hypothetical protein